ncbi:phosphopantetheine-binding protein [Azonexus sp.]|jgi:acyl carrier protein|uniref:phosphopantetheine-binding protein n=1 Tax=Azonexus sp. TaxID=1872668 RepID=UPI0028390D1F|nr:phosphopantetheine-binding protein [Azonexus sp.]MDR1994338.1 phosphopantetheine-binding protein [Azonexus sp.]
MEALELEIKNMIIDVLGLEDTSSDDIESSAALFGDGLGLDSVDALELGLALQKRYGITLDAQNQNIKQHFASVSALASFIFANRQA